MSNVIPPQARNAMPKHEIIEDALLKIFAGINQLKEALPSKEFTIDGRLVGDIGEAIVQRDYDIKLYEGLGAVDVSSQRR